MPNYNNFTCQCGHGVTSEKALVPSVSLIEAKVGYKPTIDEIGEEALCTRCAFRVVGFIPLRLEDEETIKCTKTGYEGNRMYTRAPQILELKLGRKPVQDDFRAEAVSFRYVMDQAREKGWYGLDKVVNSFLNPVKPYQPPTEKPRSHWDSSPRKLDKIVDKGEKSSKKDKDDKGAKARERNANAAKRAITESAKLLEEAVSVS